MYSKRLPLMRVSSAFFSVRRVIFERVTTSQRYVPLIFGACALPSPPIHTINHGSACQYLEAYSKLIRRNTSGRK